VTSSWFFLSTLNYDARSTTHQFLNFASSTRTWKLSCCMAVRLGKNSKYIATKLQLFINKSLRKILWILWPDQITNNELWKRTKQTRTDLQIRKREWGWLCHTLRKPFDDITRQALEWNPPQGKRSRGRPKNTWRRTVLEEAKGVKKTWAEIKWVAKNKVRWRNLVDALCSAAEWWDYWLIFPELYMVYEWST